jgi:hypothetical protein
MSEKLFQSTFQKMIGQYCWGMTYSRWINLSFKLGQARLVVESCKNNPARDRLIRGCTRVRADWFFWIWMASWRLTVITTDGKRKIKANMSSSYKQKNQVTRILNGQRLTSVEINHKTGKTIFHFDLGAELIIWRWEESAKQLWTLSKPNGYCLKVNGNGTYDHEPCSGIDKRPPVHNRPIGKSIKIP